MGNDMFQVFDNANRQRPIDRREVVEEFGQRVIVFQIIQHRSHRHSRPHEHGRPAKNVGIGKNAWDGLVNGWPRLEPDASSIRP